MARLRDTILFHDGDLEFYWEFEGNSNTTIGSNNGTDTSITYSSGNGKYNQGAGFASASTSKILISRDTFDVSAAGSFSIGGWYKGDNTDGYQVLAHIQDGNNVIELRVGAASSTDRKVRLTVRDNVDAGTDDLDSTSVVNNGNWHQITATKSGSTIKVYVDGTEEGSKTTTENDAYTFSAGSGAFGYDNISSVFPLNGALDDWFWFNRALTAAEVSNLASATGTTTSTSSSTSTTTTSTSTTTTSTSTTTTSTSSSSSTTTTITTTSTSTTTTSTSSSTSSSTTTSTSSSTSTSTSSSSSTSTTTTSTSIAITFEVESIWLN